MPRTKIPKNSKRNREAANREEKIRVYELKTDSIQLALDDKEMRYKSMTDTAIQLIQSRLQSELCVMKMSEFLEIINELEHFDDFKASDQTQQIASQSICSNTTNGGGGVGGGTANCGSLATNSRNDEGYLTEDSGISGSAISIGGNNNSSNLASANAMSTLSAYNGSALRSARAMRTPGPLHSARARRERRSRSACGNKLGQVGATSSSTTTTTTGSSNSSNAHRNSRSKLRTPMASRPKAFSADRTSRKPRQSNSPSSPPMAFLRWPKPGEVALSKFGSPIVAQVMPDKFANVNIPIRNGVLSLRPRKLGEIKADLLENLDADTLSQIKTLHENLQLIVDTASKAGLK
ncbi:hypothetical protein KR044_006248 [Drosophila immigrans]|nr:hypothetical protein KR044_006248 [Drosophila immigrans]